MEIEVKNWEKYNPRGDLKNPTWFRFNNSVLHDPQFDEFSAEEMLVYVSILCLASMKNKTTIFVTEKWLAKSSRAKITSVTSALEKLQQIQCVRLTSNSRTVDPESNEQICTVDFQNPCTTERTNERTNERTISSNSKISFEPLAVFGEVPENSVIRECGSELQETWVNTYRDPLWIKSEALKARAWLLANRHKPKKRLDRFFNAWLLKASKDLPSNKPSGSGPLNHVKNTRSFSCSTCGGTSYTNSQQGPQCVACF